MTEQLGYSIRYFISFEKCQKILEYLKGNPDINQELGFADIALYSVRDGGGRILFLKEPSQILTSNLNLKIHKAIDDLVTGVK